METIQSWDEGCPKCGSSKYGLSLSSHRHGGSKLRLQCPNCDHFVEQITRSGWDVFQTIDEATIYGDDIKF